MRIPFLAAQAAAYWLAEVPEESVRETREQLARMAYCRQQNVLYSGNNLADQPTQSASTLQECQAECAANPHCHAMSFNQDGCFQKNREWDAGEWLSNQATTSWSKKCGECVRLDQDFEGPLLHSAVDAASIRSPVECWEVCYATPMCGAFSWRRGEGCRLRQVGPQLQEVTITDADDVVLSWSRACADAPMSSEKVNELMGYAIRRVESASEAYADHVESVMEEIDSALATMEMNPAEDMRTQLERLAYAAEDLEANAVLDPGFGDQELTVDEKVCTYDAQGNRTTALESMRAKIRAERENAQWGGGAANPRRTLEEKLTPEYDETSFRKNEKMLDDVTAEEMQVDACIERGVRYMGGDLADGFVAKALTFYQCYKACDEREECHFFNFTDSEGCSLKGRDAAETRRYTQNSADLSASRTCFNCSQVGVRYLGHNLTEKPLEYVTSSTECQRLCERSEKCGAATFTDGVGCLLKSAEAKKERAYTGSLGDRSWLKECGRAVNFCREDEHVKAGRCVACPAGLQNQEGDDPSGEDTQCDMCRWTGVRFSGSQMQGSIPDASTAEQCTELCAATEECQHMSFTRRGQCMMFGATEPRRRDTGNDRDVSWSKQCQGKPVSLDEFKAMVLKDGDQFVKLTKQQGIVKMSEIVDRQSEGKASFEDLIVSENDEVVLNVAKLLTKVADQRRRLAATVNRVDCEAVENASARRACLRRRLQSQTTRRTYRRGSHSQTHQGRRTVTRSSRRQVRPSGPGPLIKDKHTEDEVIAFLNNVESADFVGLAGTGGFLASGPVNDIMNILNVIQPLVAAGVTSNKEVRYRQLLEAKLAVLKALPLPMPIQILFSFAHQMVDKTNGHFGNRSIDWNELRRYIGPITVTAVLEVIGNGHLKDIRNLFRITRKVLTAGDLSALTVTDMLTIAMACMRTKAAIVGVINPIAGIPLSFAVGVIKIVRDGGWLDTPETERLLHGVTDLIQRGPVGFLVRAAGDVARAVDQLIKGAVQFVFGQRRRSNYSQRRGVSRFSGRPKNIVQVGAEVIGGVVHGTAKVAHDIVHGVAKGVGDILTGGRRRRRHRNNWRRSQHHRR